MFDLRRISNTINQITACTIATSLIHSKTDYCNSLLLNQPATQTNRLQLEINSAAHFVTKTPKLHHITPILESLHRLKINERIKHKVLTLSHIINLSNWSTFLTSALFFSFFFHSLHIVRVIHDLHLLWPLVTLLSPLVLGLQTNLSIILLLLCGIVCRLIYDMFLITSLLHLHKS